MILITTASLVDIDAENAFAFLGEWCFKYPNNIRGPVLPYHWDDRDKLYRDFGYLQNINRELISELTGMLNELHNVNYSRKYWDLMLGYWVNLYTAILYDRWSMVKVAEKSELIDEVCVTEYAIDDFVASNILDFNSLIFIYFHIFGRPERT